MLNAEKYKDEILKILEHARLAFDESTKSVCGCDECDCNDCKFNHHQNNCGLECFKWLMEEYKEPILTDEEREYLKAVCKPFLIDRISKDEEICECGYYFIRIQVGKEYICLPSFHKTFNMYKNMELGKEYTPQELGITCKNNKG